MVNTRKLALIGCLVLALSFPLGSTQASSLALSEPEAATNTPGTLAATVAAFADRLGLNLYPTDALADLSPSESAAIAAALGSLLDCQALTDAVLPQALGVWANDGPADAITWGDEMKQCGEQATVRMDALSLSLNSLGAPSTTTSMVCWPIDIWPILYYERCGTNTVYLHDYILLIDVGGNDEYYNNAGGTVIDVMRGPVNSIALNKTADGARGCQTDQELNRGSGNCVIAPAALLDQRGNDIYQRLQTPEADSNCTSDLLVRRLATTGSGVIGVGLLLDERGNDVYFGKTLAIGMGHSGGFGLLRDREGNDIYRPIRSSAGAGVLVGLGVLDEQGGDDNYQPYNPAGGVIDNNGVCRAGNANLFGAGLIAAVGVLHERSGTDTYNVTNAVNTLGSGDLAGVGIMFEEDGTDNYVGTTNRTNSMVFVGPTFMGAGVFRDVP